VTLEARERGAIVRPLGDTIVLMPPLAIDKANLVRLVEITAASIEAAHRSAYRSEPDLGVDAATRPGHPRHTALPAARAA
jgi:hypothetical protein